ncbi:hypothetical protein LR48_Vigan263s000900 [Vigna angularis]|uniref:Transmembrane protein n=1 Tax=Phaseolus angularis TaxID=3914 RepID=A0A0L9T7P9_PHAAN|nr:hypothetical protein LR48_Vigan263s000900 [Vigna angularis]
MTVEKRMSDSGEEFPVDDDPICLMILLVVVVNMDILLLMELFIENEYYSELQLP